MVRGLATISFYADDVAAAAKWYTDLLAVEQLAAMGATGYEPPTERESGFATASFVDPLGNVLGIMTNPHYLEVKDLRNPS